MPNDKILEKIKNLLALATGEGGTESERISAMSFAQKLMAKHCLDLNQLEGRWNEESLPVVSELFVPSGLYPISSTLVKWMPVISMPICESLGGFCTYNQRNGEISLWGYEPTVKILQYTLNVVLKQGCDVYKKEYMRIRSVSFAESFWQGFAQGIALKFSKPVSSESSNELAIYDKVKAKRDGFKSTQISEYGSASLSEFGRQSGKNVTVHKAMKSSMKGNLLG